MGKSINIFEQKFKTLFKPVKKVHDEDENVAGGAGSAFGPSAGEGHGGISNTDWYAPGDARVPKALGVYSRRGKVKTKKKKTRRKNKKNK